MKLSLRNSKTRKIDENLAINDILSDPNAAFDFVIANLNGDHPFVINKISDRAYFILSGSGEVRVANNRYNVKKDDFIFIPKNTIHTIKGNLKYIIITSPPFNPANEEIIKK